MTSTSIRSIRTKSTNWLRSNWSANSVATPTTTVRTDDSVADPSDADFNFENLLPDTCRKFGCPVPVLVTKEFLTGDASKKLLKRKESSVKSDDTEKTKSEKKGKSPGKKLAIEKTVIEIPTAPPNDAILVTSRYDKANRLVEIQINKSDLRNREFILVMAVLVPLYTYVNKIIITRCRMIAHVLYDLNKMLPFADITELCLDESSLLEANYAILLDTEGSKLKYLSLARCCINDMVCAQIASKLHGKMIAGDQLLSLNLSSNHITDEGAKFLADALRTNRQLKYLSLASNRIGDEGLSHILNFLKEFPLTSDEINEIQTCHLKYLKNRFASSMEQLHRASHFDSFSESRTISPCSQKSQTKKSSLTPKGGEKKRQSKSSKTSKSLSAQIEKPKSGKTGILINTDNLGVLNAEVFDSYYECMGPYNTDAVTKKDGWVYCKGNLELCYLNMSYNDVTYVSLRKILDVLTYQDERRQEAGVTGLVRINIEGNPMPVTCTELTNINSMLAKITNSRGRLSSYKDVGKRKSVAL